MNLSDTELQIVSFLQNRSEPVQIEDLYKFSKPGAKPKTVQKRYTDLVLKFKRAEQPIPWQCKVSTSIKDVPEIKVEKIESIGHEGQRLVQIRFAPKPKEPELTDVERDYRLDRNCMAVISKQDGKVILSNHEDWYVMKFFFENAGRRIFLDEFKDVLWEHAGSRLPARWFDAVQRRIQNLRRAIPSLKDRLITVNNNNTGTFYLFE